MEGEHCERFDIPVSMYCSACLSRISQAEDPDTRRGGLKLTLLNHLVRSGAELSKVQIPLQFGAEKVINTPCIYGITPLYNAMIYNCAEVIEYLMDHYSHAIDYHHRDQLGRNIMHIFSEWRRPDNSKEIEYFFEKLATNSSELIKDLINQQDVYGNTPILIAYTHNKKNLVKTLLDYGANPAIQNNKGDSIISMETSGNQEPYVNKYLESFLKTPEE